MPEYRYDSLHDTWVIISPARADRPQPPPKGGGLFADVASCPFCPGRETETPDSIYLVPSDAPPGEWRLRIFPNKYPAVSLLPGVSAQNPPVDGTGTAAVVGYGYHEVVIETREHDSRFGTRAPADILCLLGSYLDRLREIRADPAIQSVEIFKNSGANAGASIAHPHSQIVATPFVPRVLQTELEAMARYFTEHGQCMLCAAAERELETGERLVSQNDSFVAFCPFASRVPFETILVPRRHEKDFATLASSELEPLGSILQDVVRRVTALLAVGLDNIAVLDSGSSGSDAAPAEPPPYNYLLHTFPCSDPDRSPTQSVAHSFHWHFEILPRVGTFGGFEWGTGTCINSITPERAAEVLRGL